MTEEIKCWEHEECSRAGHVTVQAARLALVRFVSSHFRNPTEHARFSIPADPERDDDFKLLAFICQAERAFEQVERLKLLVDTARTELLDRSGYGRCDCNVARCEHDELGNAITKLLPE